jgi:hypothetical protein
VEYSQKAMAGGIVIGFLFTARPPSFILTVCLSPVIQSGAGIFDAETYISTQPAQALKEARVPDSHEDQKRGQGAVAPPGQGTQARFRETGFPRVAFPPRQ